MKPPILKKEQLQIMYYPELEIALLRLKRQIHRSSFGLFMQKIIKFLLYI